LKPPVTLLRTPIKAACFGAAAYITARRAVPQISPAECQCCVPVMSELHQMVEQARQSALCHAARARRGLLTNVSTLRVRADESVRRAAGLAWPQVA
jgi:hypothetical protein